jgi:hypothetical protein
MGQQLRGGRAGNQVSTFPKLLLLILIMLLILECGMKIRIRIMSRK